MRQERQCMYNVTSRSFCVTTVNVESSKYYIFWVCVCSLRYPACSVHAPYCQGWPDRLYNIFSTLSHKRYDFREKKTLFNIKCVFCFSLQILWNVSHSKKKWERYDHTCILVFMQSTCHTKRLRWSRSSVLAFGTQVRGFKPGRSRRIFQGEKILSTPSFGGEVKPSVPCRRFTVCKIFLNATWKSGISGKIHRPFLAHIILHVATRISGWRLVVKVGTSKNNKV